MLSKRLKLASPVFYTSQGFFEVFTLRSSWRNFQLSTCSFNVYKNLLTPQDFESLIGKLVALGAATLIGMQKAL